MRYQICVQRLRQTAFEQHIVSSREHLQRKVLQKVQAKHIYWRLRLQLGKDSCELVVRTVGLPIFCRQSWLPNDVCTTLQQQLLTMMKICFFSLPYMIPFRWEDRPLLFVVGTGPIRDSRSMNPKLYTSPSVLAIFLHNSKAKKRDESKSSVASFNSSKENDRNEGTPCAPSFAAWEINPARRSRTRILNSWKTIATRRRSTIWVKVTHLH